MGQVGIGKLMLRAKGVEKESRNALGETPLCTAARHNRIDMLEALVLEGAYTEARGVDGRTPLGHAVRHPQPEGVRLLLESGADVNVRRRIMYDTVSYYTRYIPCIHLYSRICSYVHLLYMYIHHIHTSNYPIYTLYTPYIHPIYTLYTPLYTPCT